MMLEAHVAPNQALRIPYTFPPNAAVKVQVFATQPVNVYMVDSEALAAFTTAGPAAFIGPGQAKPWFSSENRTTHSFPVRLPPRQQWNLLVVNPSGAPVTLNYDVTIEGYGFGPSGMSGPSGSYPYAAG